MVGAELVAPQVKWKPIYFGGLRVGHPVAMNSSTVMNVGSLFAKLRVALVSWLFVAFLTTNSSGGRDDLPAVLGVAGSQQLVHFLRESIIGACIGSLLSSWLVSGFSVRGRIRGAGWWAR